MGMSLKDINRPLLGLVLLANISVYLTVLSGQLAIDAWVETLKSIEMVLATGVSILAGVLNGQIGHANKARLVFWKWSNPLPGSRAFTKYVSTDSRIDIDALLALRNPLPTKPEEQNSLWFKWYLEYREEASIRQVHREYLFSRDYTCLSLVFLVCITPIAFWQLSNTGIATVYAVGLLQYFVVRRAARNHGERFVTSVLAHKAAGVQVVNGGR